MKSGLIKRILATVMMVMLLAGDLIPSLANTISGGDAVVVEPAVVDEEQIENTEQIVNADVTTDITVNTNDSVDVEVNEDQASNEETETVVEADTQVSEEAVDVNQDVEEVIDEEVTVSDGDAESEEVVEEAVIVTLDSVTVDGVTITVSGPETAFEEGTTVSAVAVEPAEVVIEAAEENEQAIVKKYKAFDINLVNNGEFVQPLNGEQITVNFEGDMLIPDTDEDVAVYHVDDNDNLTKMDAEVAPLEIEEETVAEETVAMETTHFSVYVIVVTAEITDQKVTFKHYLGTHEERDEIYAPSEIVVHKGADEIFKNEIPVQGGNNYTMTQFVVTAEGEESVTYTNDVNSSNEEVVELLAEENVIEIYYEENEQVYKNDTTFFDYYVDGWIDGSYETFNSGINRSADPSEPFLAMGLSNKGNVETWMPWAVTSNYDFTITKDGVAYNFNTNNSNSNGVGDGQAAIIPGIVKELTGSSYENLVMGMTDQGKQIQEPGYFDNTVSDDKAIYENYSLVFKQSGNTYQLDYALNDSNGNKTYSYIDGALNKKFMPLDDAPIIGGRTYYQADWWEYADNFGTGNFYFGMRYDFTFNVGEYIGPLEYWFEGDDDLWVFVDGKLVLDLGGMHSAYPGYYEETPEDNTVDLWKAVYGVDTTQENWWEALTEEQKAEKHQVTILYMERGGFESTCGMRFVIPNVESKAPVVSRIPKTDIEIVKKDSESKETIAYVGFTLYSDAACTQAIGNEVFTGETGKVQFNGLKAGTYYLKETTYDAASYEANNTVYTVVVTADDATATAVLQNAEKDGEAYVVYNTPIKNIDLKFQKVEHGKLNNKLVGAEFVLTSESDASFKKTAVSGEDGIVIFENIPEGVYYLTETKAPEGFVLPNKPWVVRVSEFEGVDSDSYWGHGTVYDEAAGLQYKINGGEGPTGLWQSHQVDGVMYIKNDRPATFEFTKVDAETKAPMKDVEFTLYSSLSAEMNAEVAKAVSDEEGKVVFENLAHGNYLLVETPVEGYVVAEPWILSVVNNDGKYTLTLYDAEYIEAIDGYAIKQASAYEEMVIENTPDKPEIGALVITKTVDEVNMIHGEATFTFKIEGPEGEVLYRTITFDEEVTNGASKSVTISNLPVGTYKVTELKTLRYKCVNEEQSKDVAADQTTTFEFYNEKVFDNFYSHSDVKVNVVTFERDADGNIIGSNISQQITSNNK